MCSTNSTKPVSIKTPGAPKDLKSRVAAIFDFAGQVSLNERSGIPRFVGLFGKAPYYIGAAFNDLFAVEHLPKLAPMHAAAGCAPQRSTMRRIATVDWRTSSICGLIGRPFNKNVLPCELLRRGWKEIVARAAKNRRCPSEPAPP
jgi:hypothetical protein